MKAWRKLSVGGLVCLTAIFNLPAQTAKPLDSDGDGIPDYIEDANGNGIVDPGETDPHNPMTDGVTPDAYNSVYDDVDLSGNGLVGRVKKALGLNPLDPNNPFTLKQIITGDEPDIITFEIPISYNLLTNVGGLNLNINGVDATLEEIDPATNGHCLLVWNSTYEPPLRQHLLQAQIMLNGVGAPSTAKLSGMGQLITFYSSNVVQFFESGSMFDDNGAYLDARLPSQYDGQTVSYTIQLNDPSTSPPTPIKTIIGSTSSGMIQEDWDLTYDDGTTHFTGDAVDAVFTVTFPDSTSSLALRKNNANASSNSASGKNTKRLNRATGSLTEWGPNMDVVYVYMPTNGVLASSFAKDGEVWSGMLGVVNALTMPVWTYEVYNSDFDHYFCYYCPPGQQPYPGYVQDMTTVTNVLFPDLTNGITKQIYIKAHGSGTSLGNWAGTVEIYSDTISQLLGNIYKAKGGLKTKNPYRFVFLDGCSTASAKNWRRAFGVYPLDAPNQAARNKVGPQAYVGWEKEHTGWMDAGTGDSTRDENLAYAYTQNLNNFYSLWMHNVSLAQCIASASVAANGTAPLPVPQNKKVTIWGTNPNNGPFNYPYTDIDTSRIFVVGHSGLKVSGSDGNYDNYYVAPANTE